MLTLACQVIRLASNLSLLITLFNSTKITWVSKVNATISAGLFIADILSSNGRKSTGVTNNIKDGSDPFKR